MSRTNNIFLLTVFTILILSCQQEVFEVELPSSDQAILVESELKTNLLQVATLDGSFDNVIDNSSCFSVVLPIEVSVVGELRFLSTKQDIKDLENFFENRVRNREYLQLEYPLTLISSAYERYTVSDFSELDALTSECIEGGQDIDNECIDISYPVSLSSYDLINQKASTIKIDNDEELYSTLQRNNEDHLISFNFPFDLIFDEQVVTAAGNTDLAAFLLNSQQNCDENDEPFYTSSAVQLGTLSLELTDAPYPIGLLDSANITITGIEVQTGEGNDSVEYLMVSEDTFNINLLDLSNGITQSLVETELYEGNYKAIILSISSARVVLTDGREFDLKVPSGRIRIKNGDEGFDIVANGQTKLLADVDVSRSFVIQGNPDTPAGIKGFIFKPVINLSNFDESGSIGGRVTDEGRSTLEDVEITLLAADTVYTTTFSNDDGNYKILGVPEGLFTLQASLDGFQEFLVEDVDVKLQEETTVDITLNE